MSFVLFSILYFVLFAIFHFPIIYDGVNVFNGMSPESSLHPINFILASAKVFWDADISFKYGFSLCTCFRLSAELTAFSSGMGILWNAVRTNKDVLKPLFVYESSPLSLLQLRKLYCVQWAESGTGRRASEEDTMAFFESFLQDCEGK